MESNLLRYTESHEWIRVEGPVGIVGISKHAQGELGEIVSVELPNVGQLVQSGKEVCVLESTKAAADVYSPVSGKVIAINEELRKTPSLVNQYAEDAGWLFKLELSNSKELENLLSEKEYQKLVSS